MLSTKDEDNTTELEPKITLLKVLWRAVRRVTPKKSLQINGSANLPCELHISGVQDELIKLIAHLKKQALEFLVCFTDPFH